MAKLSGFVELLPAERMVELQVLDHLRQTFELHGFANIETRAVEPVSELLRKGEIDKEVYAVKRLQEELAQAPAKDADSGAALALHFDLTVPFARYIVEHANDLAFPFRRYQIQKVWRGERPQQGRFREFTQADIDIVGRDTLSFTADIDIAQVMVEALSGLPVPRLTMQINNRKLLEGFYRGIGADDPTAVMRVIDKIDKVGEPKIAQLLQNVAGLDAGQAELCIELSKIHGPAERLGQSVRSLGVTNELLDEGLTELERVLAGIGSQDSVNIVGDLRIARGLDYYTGTVFETQMAGFEHLGSICSGGRYDQLARDNRSTYPGVGISLGVSRLLVPLFAEGLTAARSVPSVVLVALSSEDTADRSAAVAAALRGRGINTEVAPLAQKYGQQIKYAERRGIPFVWFVDAGAHEVRDIRTGDQVAADPESWNPPKTDLRAAVVQAADGSV